MLIANRTSSSQIFEYYPAPKIELVWITILFYLSKVNKIKKSFFHFILTIYFVHLSMFGSFF